MFGQKFKSSHKSLPGSLPAIEREISGSKRAQKVARRVNQSETLRDFQEISPRLCSYITDLVQEKSFSQKVIYRRAGNQTEARNYSINPI